MLAVTLAATQRVLAMGAGKCLGAANKLSGQ